MKKIVFLLLLLPTISNCVAEVAIVAKIFAGTFCAANALVHGAFLIHDSQVGEIGAPPPPLQMQIVGVQPIRLQNEPAENAEEVPLMVQSLVAIRRAPIR